MSSYYLSEDLPKFGEIGKATPELWSAYLAWYTASLEPGALDGKTKKLIALAVAVATQEPYCIDAYSSACTDAGATPEELAELFNVVGAMKGGGVLAHWAQAQNTLARKG
jgi:alkylhydroperoxidase/carboxymuconolactone decarboxylase family protein